MKNFALIGAAGYIAPRHLQAIHDTGNQLAAAVDPHDCVGGIDRWFPDARFFTEIERFDRFLEKRRRGSAQEQIDYVSVCSPNYLHDAHVRMALRVGADAICEKPLVISPWNLDALEELQEETNRRIYTILQLRLIDRLAALKRELAQRPPTKRLQVRLTYVTRRGPWYHVSWKGSREKSGGLAMNIGVHLFDLLLWLFGDVQQSTVHLNSPEKMAGALELDSARVSWFLSVDAADLPQTYSSQGKYAYRSLTIDGEELEFSTGFTDLHTRMYEEILAGRGLGIEEARPSIELIHAINHAEVSATARNAHPLLPRVSGSELQVPSFKFKVAG